MEIEKIFSDCAAKEEKYEYLEGRIKYRKEQIARLEKRKEGLRVYWKDDLVRPIAEELLKHLPGRYYDVLGPFGLGARVSIHFYLCDAENKFDDCLSITFEPNHIKRYAHSISDEMCSFERSKIHRKLCDKMLLDYNEFRPFESSRIKKVPTRREAEEILWNAIRIAGVQ